MSLIYKAVFHVFLEVIVIFLNSLSAIVSVFLSFIMHPVLLLILFMCYIVFNCKLL